MAELFGSLTLLDRFFGSCALLGGVLFLIRFSLMFVGSADHGGDVHGGDAHSDISGDAHSEFQGDQQDSSNSFKLISIQGITAFFSLFGLIGLAMHLQSGFGPILSLFVASFAGLAGMWLMAWIFRVMIGLQSDGTVQLSESVGMDGEVYLTIPADGIGKIIVAIQGRLREYQARTYDDFEIKTGEKVTVLWVEENEILVVQKIQSE